MTAWNAAERKKIIIDELEAQAISFDELGAIIGKDLDPFDLILHLVYDKPPLTRRERAANVRKRNYFSKYGKQAAEILNSLLDKYSERGIDDLENIDVLKVNPINKFGTQIFIINKIFGSKAKYLAAVRELEKAIYAA